MLVHYLLQLLGLDGSLVFLVRMKARKICQMLTAEITNLKIHCIFVLAFQEHVFWVVSLNTLFILVFGKLFLLNSDNFLLFDVIKLFPKTCRTLLWAECLDPSNVEKNPRDKICTRHPKRARFVGAPSPETLFAVICCLDARRKHLLLSSAHSRGPFVRSACVNIALRSCCSFLCLKLSENICLNCPSVLAAFCPYHIGHFILIGVKFDDWVSLTTTAEIALSYIWK